MDDVFRDVPYDWSLYVENVLDVSHVSYTHHGTQGSRKMTKPFYFEELRPVTDVRHPPGRGCSLRAAYACLHICMCV